MGNTLNENHAFDATMSITPHYGLDTSLCQPQGYNGIVQIVGFTCLSNILIREQLHLRSDIFGVPS